MAGTNYFAVCIYDTGTSALGPKSNVGIGAKTTQSFQIFTDGGNYSWEVKGYAA